MPEAAAWQFKSPKRVPDRRPRPSKVLLRGRVFTGDEGGTIEDGFVLVEDGKIAAVGPAAELGSGGEGAFEVGGAGKTVLPGLFNNHAHLAWDGANDLATQSLEDPPEISAYKCASNMPRSLAAGVTTVRDLGMNKSNLFAKQAIVQGVIRGPKLLVTGEAIVQTGGHTYWCCREASGADEMRRAVREQVRAGADLIKIMGCHDTLEFTDEELAAVIDETHRNGLKITAHATYDACISRMLEFGVDTIEHGGAMSDETIQMLVDRGTYIITTFAPLVMQAEHGEAWGMPAWKIEERKRAVADTSRYDGLVKAAQGGRADRVRHRRRQPRRAARRDRARARLHGQARHLHRQRARAARDHLAVGPHERPAGRPRPARTRARGRRRSSSTATRSRTSMRRGGRGRVPRRRPGRLTRGGDTDLRARRPARAPARSAWPSAGSTRCCSAARATGGRAAAPCATSATSTSGGTTG